MRSEDIQTYTQGLCNLLEMLEIARISAAFGPVRNPVLRIRGTGDLDHALNCRSSGLFFPNRTVGDRLKSGDDVGIIRGLHGGVLETVRTSESGVLVLLRSTPRIFAGELVAALAYEEPSDDVAALKPSTRSS